MIRILFLMSRLTEFVIKKISESITVEDGLKLGPNEDERGSARVKRREKTLDDSQENLSKFKSDDSAFESRRERIYRVSGQTIVDCIPSFG